jgi:hypothetical protein
MIFGSLSVGSGLLIFLTLAAVAIFLTVQSIPAITSSKEATGTADAVSLISFTAPLSRSPWGSPCSSPTSLRPGSPPPSVS